MAGRWRLKEPMRENDNEMIEDGDGPGTAVGSLRLLLFFTSKSIYILERENLVRRHKATTVDRRRGGKPTMATVDIWTVVMEARRRHFLDNRRMCGE
uniref:Uncharacterized protein n=1 Tax=Romanomermis culicivorax TaxID=13658 RepID=A0A915JSH4_ROMCU